MKAKPVRPGTGKLLISEPFLPDPNFKRTVIMLTEHNEEGSVGFILNRQLDMTINDIMDDLPKFNSMLHYGGPVEPDTLHYLHRTGDTLEGSIEITGGVYWGGNFEALKILIETKQVDPSDFQFFIGYSGWGPGQLKHELKEKSWMLTSARKEHCFLENPESLWHNVLKTMGNEYAIIANFPEDPSLN